MKRVAINSHIILRICYTYPLSLIYSLASRHIATKQRKAASLMYNIHFILKQSYMVCYLYYKMFAVY